MSLVTDLARKGKDRVLSRALEELGRRVIARYGTLSRFRLDSRDRKIELEVLLRGETDPVAVSIGRYELAAEGDKAYVVVREIMVSREWMQTLAEDMVRDRKFEIPGKYSGIINALV